MKCPFCIKQCNDCKKILVANSNNFHKQKTGKYGLAGICKTCKNKKVQQNRFNNLEKRREYDKQYYHQHKKEKNEKWKEWYKDHKEERKEYRKKYYENNKTEIRQKAKIKYDQNKKNHLQRRKELYNLNKEKIKLQRKQWRILNPEKAFNMDSKQRIKRLNHIKNYDPISTEQFVDMMNYFNWSCAYSGHIFSDHNKNDDRTVDHIIPINKNGEHVIWNMVPMYSNYNSSKSDKDMLEWYKQQEYFSEERLQKIYKWQTYAYEKWGGDKIDIPHR